VPDPAFATRDDMEVWNLDGVKWSDAPVPRRLHRCKPQTEAVYNHSLDLLQRCACGGFRVFMAVHPDDMFLGAPKPAWMERNNRRKSKGWSAAIDQEV
jgi:hypothetical protein